MRRREFLAAVTLAQLGRAEKIPLGNSGMGLHYGPEYDKPFVYPIRTVAGTVVSRGWPVEPRPGETTDHVWHRGIWWGHGSINSVDFWREQGKEKSGRLAGSPTKLLLQPPTGDPLGTVRQKYTTADRGGLRFVDAEIAISADRGQALTFGDTDDGGFAIRLADDFAEERGARLLNSDGLLGTKNIWGKPARWVHYSIATAGVAMFDHPSNFRHPTRWHARGYSLCSANPFAQRSFTRQKPLGDSYTLPTGGSLTFRYRLVIHDGALDATAIEKLYAAYRG